MSGRPEVDAALVEIRGRLAALERDSHPPIDLTPAMDALLDERGYQPCRNVCDPEKQTAQARSLALHAAAAALEAAVRLCADLDWPRAAEDRRWLGHIERRVTNAAQNALIDELAAERDRRP